MERRLAAILLTDMVGYSRLIGLDEEGTITRQKAHREEIIDPKISTHGGRIVKTTGDGVLVEFPSVVDAVKCAVEVQKEMARREIDVPEDRRIQYRIGINLGDIVIDGDDILGDGVNVAARLEALAKLGGVCISGTVYEHLAGKTDIVFEDAGEQTVKNIPRPVRVWHWQTDTVARDSNSISEPPPLPDKPSIAVLPFDNMSGDPEQEYFADGMSEDIITGLSKFRWLFVIARNSSFAYKGKSPDVRVVARDLGVRYVLERSVRRGAARLRITAQLIDAETGSHIWAERYERELADIFAVQDEVTAAIVATIAPEIGQSEIERMKRRAPESLDAWALFQQGLALYPSGAAKDYRAAIALFDKAHKLDPGFVEALVMAGHMRTRYANLFDMDNRETLLEEARELLQTAMRLDPGDATCRMAMGRWYVIAGEPEIGAEYCREAVTLNPNSVLAHFELGIALNAADRYEEALVHFDTARRLSPRDLHAAALSTGPTFALFMLGRFEEAAATAARVSRSPNPRYWADALLVAALLRLGREAEAGAAKEVLLERKPDFTIGEFQSTQRGFESISKQLGSALRDAGLPE
jgi:adenylate cyclase